MDNQRFFLIAALALVGFLIYQAWVEDYGPKPPPQGELAPAESVTAGPSEVPTVSAPEQAPRDAEDGPAAADLPGTAAAAADAPEQAPVVHVRTDVLDADISLRGGTLVDTRLPGYPRSKKKGAPPVELLSNDPGQLFLLQSGLRGYADAVAPDHTARFTAPRTEYVLGDGEEKLIVVLSWKREGIEIEKHFIFERGSYQVRLEQVVRNTGQQPWKGDSYLQLKQHYTPPEGSIFKPMVYDGPAYYDGEGYYKIDFEDIDSLGSEAFAGTITGGWAGIVQHYFLAALIPPHDQGMRYYARTLGQQTYLIGYVMPGHTVAPGETVRFENRLFLGPKLQDRLAEVAPGLELAVDYGVLTIIAEPMFWLLDQIHALVGNWGWAIILLTLLIKAVFYKLNKTSGRSMAKMRKVTPRIQALKERYKDDRQRMNMAMMELYKEEKINPAAGCLPILVQMPFFIALYWVLLYSVELRQAPWVLWINDLSAPDPFYVLPVLVGLAMFAQQQMNPPPPDPMQRKIFMFMPVAFGGFSLFMPAGLVLYWFVNTLITAGQQWHINRVIEKEEQRRRR